MQFLIAVDIVSTLPIVCHVAVTEHLLAASDPLATCLAVGPCEDLLSQGGIAGFAKTDAFWQRVHYCHVAALLRHALKLGSKFVGKCIGSISLALRPVAPSIRWHRCPHFFRLCCVYAPMCSHLIRVVIFVVAPFS